MKMEISWKIQGQHIYHQPPHYGFSIFSSLIRLATFTLLFLIGPVSPLTRSSAAAGKDYDWGKVISSLQFAFFLHDSQKFKNSYQCSLIIHPYRSKPDQYTISVAVWKAIKCGGLLCSHGVSATYPDVNLTLHVRVAQREKCGSNIVQVCAAPAACCTEPNASMFTHTHISPHGLFFHTG